MGIGDFIKNLFVNENENQEEKRENRIGDQGTEKKGNEKMAEETKTEEMIQTTRKPNVNVNTKTFKFNYGGKEIILETGKMAKQADGAVFMTCGGTQVLTTAISAKEVKDDQDFFPLLVDYKERFYAAGKFLGGFMKREGRPSNQEILLMRMIDRPMRPLFPEGYMNETIIQTNVHSYDNEVDPEIIAGLAASAALIVSDIPFYSPVGFCKVGKINGEFVLNPSRKEWEKSELELVVAGTSDAILMIEGEASELPEEEILDAIMFAHDHIKKYCAFLSDVQKSAGKKKREFVPVTPNQTLMDKITENFTSEAKKCLEIKPKQERQDSVSALTKSIKDAISSDFAGYGLNEDDDFGKKARQVSDELMYKIMRTEILKDHKRIGGRKLNEVRAIDTEVGLLKSVHGSSLFTRGETQVMAAVTIGGADGEQMVDSVHGISYQKFYLHYTFAPYCVGEARGYRGVGRREVGHGNLAERALKKVLPTEEAFPYTVRVACEVTESNGSSSMGSVCSGSLALCDAGVPIKAPVAGVAMGLIKEGDDFVILTDILGDEDHLGDMDFKVAGTEKGVTAIQMDIKIGGINRDVFNVAFKQAREGRLHILSEMKHTINKPRVEFKKGVPRIESIKIAPDKIGTLIGPSGKNIKALQEHYSCTVEVTDEGLVKVLGVDTDKIKEACATIDLQINGPKINTDYDGTVVSIKEYGAFVDIAHNVSGLLHVSEIASERVNNVEEYLKEGDIVKVRVLDIDRFGKIKLSAKAVSSLAKKTK